MADDRAPREPRAATFVTILIVWLFLLFASFGLFTPRNGLVVTALLVCALSNAGAVAMVIDLDHSFEGPIFVSSQPMRKALSVIDAP